MLQTISFQEKKESVIVMSKRDFVYTLSDLCRQFYVNNTVVVQDYVVGYKLSEVAKEVCGLIVELAMETNYFCEATKDMLKTGKSYRKVAESMKNKNKNTVMSKIYNDVNKLKRKIGEGAFDYIIRTRNVDLSGYVKILKKLIKENKKASILDNFAIKLPHCPEGLEVKHLSEEDMIKLRYMIITYSKKSVRDIEKRIKPEYIAYMRYLEENEKNLDVDEKAVYRCMRAWLVGDAEKKMKDIVCRIDMFK